jgi:U3 small nucleolar RNA-associated protein 15
VTRRRRAKLAPFDAHLRRFRHREALDAALATKRPAVVCAVLEALGVRGAIGGALAGRDAPGLLPLLNFLARHVADPRYTPMLLGVTSRLLDIYTAAVGADAAVDRALAKLAEALREEARSQQELFLVLGALEPLLCAQLRGNGGRIA